MGKIKKVIAGTLVAALIGAGGYGGFVYMQSSNEKQATVVKVGNICDTYYTNDTILDGTITTNVSQKIFVDKDVVVENVYVTKGQEVKVGDRLASFDTTLVDMELNIARLKKQKQEIDLNTAMNRLYSLQNGGSIIDSDANSGNADVIKTHGEDDDTASAVMEGGSFLGTVTVPLMLAADVLSGGDGADAGSELAGNPSRPYEESTFGNEIVMYGGTSLDAEDELSGGGTSIPVEPEVTYVTPTPGGELPVIETEATEDPFGLAGGGAVFHDVLNYNTKPYSGSGTQTDPYVFLASCGRRMVTATGSFFNRMAGFSESGTMLLKPGGYWYLIEFHENDHIEDVQDRKASCTGYYYINGGTLDTPVNPFAESYILQDEATQYQVEGEEETEEEEVVESTEESTITRAEAIKIQQKKIASLKLDIQASDINIAKLEKKAAMKEVYSRLDGVVSYVGSKTGTSNSSDNAFIRVKSKDGYFVQGTVGELMREQLVPGTRLTCTSYESGVFQATVLEVSDYPVSGESFWSEGNPNVSYYVYTASIDDQSLKLVDQDWVQVTPETKTSNENEIVLSTAFVRTENGTSYVYKSVDGKLKKSPVKSGGTVNSGYSIMVKGGLTMEDWIAFPYGDLAKDGVKTKEGTLDDLYNYS